jgi:hypothetical protein
MPATHQWTEWHLTPRGWESGSKRTNGPGTILKEGSADRVLSYRWSEYRASVFGRVKRGSERIWESDDKPAILVLLQSFGRPPEHL